jgi:mannose-6-phosphate isomerase
LSHPAPDLTRVAKRARAWLFDEALPLWAGQGVDPRDGSFYERLTLTGAPDTGAPRRVRVQARQLHVFCEAAELGWDGGASDLVRRGFDVFLERCWAPDGSPGWIHMLDADGRVIDQQRDTYDHAFALLGLASVYKVTGDVRALEHAEQTIAYLEAQLADRVHGGYAEGSAPASFRRSNPHMHLLEAFLAWHAATGERAWLDRADAMVRLFRTKFFDPASGTLSEYFERDWSRAAGAAGEVVEPGHHLEWAWLLHWAFAAGGGDATIEARSLYDSALTHGLDGSGFVVDELNRSGWVTRATRRCWPQTERIKAHLAMAKAGDEGAAVAAATAALALLDGAYLGGPVRGGWMDQFDGSGKPMSSHVPASTFYHLMVSFKALIEFADRWGESSAR